MFGSLVEIFKMLDGYSQMFAEMNMDLYFDFASMATTTIIISAITELVFFIFKGIGLFVMSKRQNMSCAWFSFVPFLSYVQMGRLVGEVKLFGTRTKQLGLFVAISMFVTNVCSWIADIGTWFEPFKQMVTTSKFDYTLYQNTMNNVSPVFSTLNIISAFSDLVYIVFWVFLLVAFFRYYEPKHPTLYILLSIFLGLTGIFVFVVRKHDKVNYFEQQRKYYENLYKEKYQNNATNSGEPNKHSENDSPFIEYSKKTEDVFAEYSQGQSQQPQQPQNNTYNSGYNSNGNLNNNSSPDNSDQDGDQDEDLF